DQGVRWLVASGIRRKRTTSSRRFWTQNGPEDFDACPAAPAAGTALCSTTLWTKACAHNPDGKMAPKQDAMKRKNRPNKRGGAKIARTAAHTKNPRASNRSRPPPLIVGLGASAGGLNAFKTFFEKVPADSGMAFVLVQHLSPDHKSALAEILSKAAAVPVLEA